MKNKYILIIMMFMFVININALGSVQKKAEQRNGCFPPMDFFKEIGCENVEYDTLFSVNVYECEVDIKDVNRTSYIITGDCNGGVLSYNYDVYYYPQTEVDKIVAFLLPIGFLVVMTFMFLSIMNHKR
jgi:hypothetical protein